MNNFESIADMKMFMAATVPKNLGFDDAFRFTIRKNCF